MEALVKYANAPGSVEIRDMPAPEIAPDQEINGRTVSDWLARAETNDVVPFDAGQK